MSGWAACKGQSPATPGSVTVTEPDPDPYDSKAVLTDDVLDAMWDEPEKVTEFEIRLLVSEVWRLRKEATA